jgi:transposase
MSLRPEPVGEIPAETARVARAAFPKGTVVTRRLCCKFVRRVRIG